MPDIFDEVATVKPSSEKAPKDIFDEVEAGNIPQLKAGKPPGFGERVGRLFSPLMGPTEREKAEAMAIAGTSTYKPAGGRIEQEGFIPALSHPPIQLPNLEAMTAPEEAATHPKSWKDAIFDAVVETGKHQADPVRPILGPRGAAVANTAKGFGEFAISPLGVATGGIGKLAQVPKAVAEAGAGIEATRKALAARRTVQNLQRGVSAAYAADMATKVPEAARQAGEASVKGTPQEKAEAYLGLGSQVVLPATLAAHAIKSIPRSANILPLAKAAAEKTIQEKAIQDASKISQAAEVHGDVRSQQESTGELPVKEGEPGVQPQAQTVAKEAQIPLIPGETKPGTTGLAPDHEKLLMDEVERGGHNVEVVTGPIGENEPFAGQIATIDRKTGKIRINPKELSDWLTHDVPEGKQAEAVRSLLGEEAIHLATTDADALAYHNSLTAAERAIGKRVYVGKSGEPLSPTMLGHELVRQRLQKVMRMSVRETLDASRRERWTVKSLLALSDAIRTAREIIGTKASREGLAIMDKVAENLNAAITARTGATPAASRKRQQEADDLEGKYPGVYNDPETQRLRDNGQVPVEIKKADGSTAPALFNGYWEGYGEPKASVAYKTPEGWSHGMLPEGDKIVGDVPTPEEWRKRDEETPAARRKKDRETLPLFLPHTPEKVADQPGAAELGALPAVKIPPEKALQTDTVHWNKPNAWRRLTREDFGKPYTLGKKLTEGARVSYPDPSGKVITTVDRMGIPKERVANIYEPVSTTKRLVALEKDGKVYVVSIYPDADDGARLVDPVLQRTGHKRPNVPIRDLLNEGYKPIASILRNDGVQNFLRQFDSVQDFEDKVGKPNDDMWASVRGYEAETQASQASSFGKGAQVTDAEAGALHDHLKKYDSPDGAAEAVATSPNKQQLRSFFGKAINQIMKDEPDYTREQAAGKALHQLYEQSKYSGKPGFVKEVLRQFGRETPESIRESLARETPSHFEEAPAPDEGDEAGPYYEGGRFSVEGGEVSPYSDQYDPDAEQTEPGAIRKYARDQQRMIQEEIDDAMTKGVTAGTITRGYGNAQNLPNVLAQRDENSIRMASAEKPTGKRVSSAEWKRGNKDVLSAANALVQAQAVRANGTIDHGRRSQLNTFRAQLNAGNAKAQQLIATGDWRDRRLGQRWLRSNAELMKEVDYADAHWNDPALQNTAIRMKQALDAQWAREKAQGLRVEKDPNYVPQRYDAAVWNEHSILFDAIVGGGDKIIGKGFRKPRTFNTYYAAAAEGPYVPVTRDGASLVSHRIRQGMSLVERNAWAEGLKAMQTPSGEPVAQVAKIVNGQPTAPSRNYSVMQVGGKWLAIHDDFKRLINQLDGTSQFEDAPLLGQAMRLSMMIKHTAIIGDIFHLMKTGYFAASILRSKFGLTSFRKGWTALDLHPKDIPEAVSKGIISQKDADWANEQVQYGNQSITRRQLAEKFVKEGANLGKIQDALYKDLATHVSPGAGGAGKLWSRLTDPSIGRWNRFLFDKFTRGLMAQANVAEFERQSKANPTLNPDKLVRDISRDVNNRFGNIGKQGWIKSSTWQDIQRLLWFAPNWEAGIIKSELAGYSRLSGLSTLAGKVGIGQGRKGVTPFGTAGASMATGMATLMAMAQVANLITRGKPTWENEEKGHMFDAYIPGSGDNPGYWFSPLSIFNETVNDIWRYKQSDRSFLDAVDKVQGNKESALFRAGMIAVAGQGPMKFTSTGGQLKAAAQQLVPVPITFGKFAQAGGHMVAPNVVPPVAPGSLLRQGASSLGFKLEPKFTDSQEVSRRAKDFAKQEGFAKDSGWVQVETDEPNYTKLRQALRIGDEKEAKRQVEELQKTHTDKQIYHAMKTWARRPFTGSKAAERAFIGSLDDKGLEMYQRAIEQQDKEYEKWTDFALRNL